MIELLFHRQGNTKKNDKVIQGASCTQKHLALCHASCLCHNIDIHIYNHIVNHIKKRHGPYDCVLQYNMQKGWNRPTMFIQGSDFAIQETLIKPDVVTARDQHKKRHVVYCKEFDFPIGIDNNGNVLYTCKAVVHVGKYRNHLITAFPLKKALQEKHQCDCTILCTKINR